MPIPATRDPRPETPLTAVKGDICNALWPTYSGCLYGRSCDAEKRVRLDAMLEELHDHFGERLMPLARELHAEMTRSGFGPPRTFLAHMQKLQTRMIQELQNRPSPGAPASSRQPLRFQDVAMSFLQSIGFARPPLVKIHSTCEILEALAAEGFDEQDIRAACDLAVAAGAHGPGLIPHMIGREPPAPYPAQAAAVAHIDEHAQAEQASHDRWAELSAEFDELLLCERDRFIDEARRTNRTIASRPSDHPLVRAAAIQLYAQEIYS